MQKKIDMFTIQKWKIDAETNSVQFRFECGTYGAFEEVISFPAHADIQGYKESEVLHNLLDVMAAYLGVSYYKLSAVGHLKIDMPFSDIVKNSIEKIYTEGLGEFYIRNALKYPPAIEFSYEEGSKKSLSVSEDALRQVKASKVTVAFGGGKDSHASVGLLGGVEVTQELVSVVLSDTVKATLERLSGGDLTFIKRRIDPKLIVLVKEGQGYNGHIPITAINSMILTIYSLVVGNEWVVFSNERGASVPTMHHDGHDINHQYSKSFEFESLFRDVVNNICGDRVQYFSLLRSFSELWIAKYLATKVPTAHLCFSSCNKNFIFEGQGKLEAGKRWCGKCSKCVYTAIIIAPHVTREKFLEIFRSEILNDADNIQISKDLCGIGACKPWECVGDFSDTAAALSSLLSKEEWGDSLVLNALSQALSEKYGAEYLRDRFTKELSSRGEDFLPYMLENIGEDT